MKNGLDVFSFLMERRPRPRSAPSPVTAKRAPGTTDIAGRRGDIAPDWKALRWTAAGSRGGTVTAMSLWLLALVRAARLSRRTHPAWRQLGRQVHAHPRASSIARVSAIAPDSSACSSPDRAACAVVRHPPSARSPHRCRAPLAAHLPPHASRCGASTRAAGSGRPARCALGRHEPTSRRCSFRHLLDDRHSGAHDEHFLVVAAAVSREQQESVVGGER